MAFRLPLFGLIALSLFGILCQGLPSVSLQPRGKAQIVIDLLKIFGLVTEETDAWVRSNTVSDNTMNLITLELTPVFIGL
jgi:hypothetical protein